MGNKKAEMKVVNFIICVLIATNGFSQVNTFYIEPVLTDPNYNAVQDSHMVVRNTVTTNDKLLLFIGGTGSKTKNYLRISEFAGNLGYDVINVSYPNSIAAASLANSSDNLVFNNYRQEICYGTNLSSDVSVDSLNSIFTRVVNLINYLDTAYPSQNWSQYLISSNTLNWSKIAVAGHSQGAGHACYFAKYESTERVLMFSGPNDYSNHFAQPANWLGIPGVTQKNRHFVYLSLYDEAVEFSKQLSNISDLGIYPETDTVHVDVTNSPFNNSHCLFTTQPPGLVILNHNSTIKWSILNNSVWEYMLTSESTTNVKEIEYNHLFSIYPNPAKSQLNIQPKKNILGKTYYVRNNIGQVIWSGTVNDSSISISLTEFLSGLYFFSIENQTSAFIKE